MSQPIYQQLDPKTIEALKAARNQVTQANPAPESPAATRYGAGKSGNEDKNAARGQSLNPIQTQFAARNKFAPLETHNKEPQGQQLSKNIAVKSLTGFAEEFVQKLTSIEKETAEVDEEIAKAEKLWASLAEKKKQLEARRNELTKVKDKLKELNKEMSDVLKSQ